VHWLTHPWLLALGILVLLLLAAWAHLAFWVRRYAVPARYAEEARIATPDGSAIELRRLPPPPTPSLPPILMVHGLAANHRNVDTEPDRSLARHLHAEERDVWLLTLRSGRADRRRAERSRIRFAAMVEHDLPLAIEHVLSRTGAEAVDYVGFSMGGMLMYAALGRTVAEARVRRAVIIGSPGRIDLPFRVLRIFRWMPRLFVPSLWLRLGARMTAFLVEALPLPLEHFIFNRANVARGAVARALVNIIEDIPGSLQADFNEWAFSDGVIRVDGEPVLEGLATVEVPALFFAGAKDRIASPAAVRAAFDAWGREGTEVEKEWRLLARAEGAAEDYGHGDLAIGEHLPADLFGPAALFLGQA